MVKPSNSRWQRRSPSRPAFQRSGAPARIAAEDAATAADAAIDPILVVDAEAVVRYANKAAHNLVGASTLIRTQLTSSLRISSGHELTDLLGPTSQRALAVVEPSGGTPFEAELSIGPAQAQPHADDDGQRWVIVAHALPSDELSIREMLRRATHDDLTALANRSTLLDSIEATLNDARTSAGGHLLALIDLDDFKQINDSWGHDMGDRVLREVGARLRQLCRPGDVVARLGGDEFAAWCRWVSPSDADALASRFMSIFDDPVNHGTVHLEVSGSVGIATTKEDSDPAKLLRQADSAMYRAKELGKGQHALFDDDMASAIEHRGKAEEEFRHALWEDQIVLHYQPVIDLTSSQIVGVEALARWEHPTRGRISPGEFLPIAEATSLSGELDTQIISRACHQLARWQEEIDTSVAMWINVSPTHLTDRFVGELSDLLLDLTLDPSSIVLELTEEATAGTSERIAVLEALHDFGVRIAIDDFGTGFSQLAYLPELPLDILKLDRSFVDGIAGEPKRLALASSVINLAHAIGAKVVAEGVEHEEDLDAVRSLGCDHAQGFLLARPAPPDELLAVTADLTLSTADAAAAAVSRVSRRAAPGLGRFVEKTFVARCSVDDEPEQIAPTGSATALLVLGAPIRQVPDDGEGLPHISDTGLMAGPHERPMRSEAIGETVVVGIVATPVGCEALFDADPAALRGRVVDLTVAWPTGARLRERIQPMEDPKAMLDEVDATLLRELRPETPGLDRCERAVAALADEPTTSVDHMASDLGISRGHLDREFTRLVGMTPRKLARIMRVQLLVETIHLYGSEEWNRITAHLGWTDELQMVRDFARHTGMVPGEFAALKASERRLREPSEIFSRS